MASALRRNRAVLLACLAAGFVVPAIADGDTPSIVVSPYFFATSIARAGSTVSVITREQIEKSSAGSVAELLRSVPGLTVTETGGVGGTTGVSLRGAEVQHTLVLIDGIRVNDPATPRSDFDFATLSLTDVERIEVLKGPQSALYGSDAMGGVINIIMRRRTGKSASATVEGGSYGTRRSTVSGSASNGPLTVSGSGTYFFSDGFSRVGNRDTGEPDSTEKYAGTVRATYDPGENWKFEAGIDGDHQFSEVDKSSTKDASGYSISRDLLSAFGRFSFDAPDGGLKNTFTVFGSQTKRRFDENGPVTNYLGSDVGAEYRGLLALEKGSLIFGTRFEEEGAYQQKVGHAATFDTTRSLYAGYFLYQLPVGERLNVSFAGRYDGEVDGQGFTTGRATAVYDVPELNGRIRGSIGTGAKRPTSYQLALNPLLDPEKSFGADLGWEQSLFNDRLTVSATGFYNRFENLIDFTGDFITGNYHNVKQAETAGVEFAGTASLVPGVLSATASYTYLYSHDLSKPTGVPLQRRPQDSGKVELTYTGIENLEASVSATLIGNRFNDSDGLVGLPGYVLVNLSARYHVNSDLTVFGRVDNLFDATYQEVSGYNTPGLSAYVGLTWAH
jgi:vitamin B12 transporter